MPAVERPGDGELNPDKLADLLTALAPEAVGASITVVDPDLNPTERQAALSTATFSETLTLLGCNHLG